MLWKFLTDVIVQGLHLTEPYTIISIRNFHNSLYCLLIGLTQHSWSKMYKQSSTEATLFWGEKIKNELLFSQMVIWTPFWYLIQFMYQLFSLEYTKSLFSKE